MKGDPLRGVHAIYSGEREWWAPLYPAPAGSAPQRAWRCSTSQRLRGSGRARMDREAFRDDTGTLLVGQYRLMVRTERTKAPSGRSTTRSSSRPTRRTRSPRSRRSTRGRLAEPSALVEDVDEGDDVGPMVKAPHGHRHGLLARRHGLGLYGVKPCDWAGEPRGSRFFHRDDLNIPDAMQRALGSRVRARRATPPRSTTGACGRRGSSTCAPTGWGRRSGKLDCEFQLFNYVGDTHWMRGTVSQRTWLTVTARGRPGALGREPARRSHHPGPRRSSCPARSTGGTPPRPARRRRPGAGPGGRLCRMEPRRTGRPGPVPATSRRTQGGPRPVRRERRTDPATRSSARQAQRRRATGVLDETVEALMTPRDDDLRAILLSAEAATSTAEPTCSPATSRRTSGLGPARSSDR